MSHTTLHLHTFHPSAHARLPCRQAMGNKVDPLEIFQHFDTDDSGLIDLPEFSDGLERLGIYLTKSEVQALVERFSSGSADHPGEISFAAFARSLGLDGSLQPAPLPSGAPSGRGSGRRPSSPEQKELEDDIMVRAVLRHVFRTVALCVTFFFFFFFIFFFFFFFFDF